MRILIKLVLPFFLTGLTTLLAPCAPDAAPPLQLSKGLGHYAQEMEFYYSRPRPEILRALLVTLSHNGILTRAENRLLVAAFYAQLVRNGSIKLEALNPATDEKDTLHTLAWAAHLSASPSETQIQALLKSRGDTALVSQLNQSPACLEDWAPAREPSTLLMFWGAYMATGDSRWVDLLIDSARSAPAYGSSSRLSAIAAALLYEYAPGHPGIGKRIEETIKRQGPDSRLQIILEHGKTQR